MDNDTSSDEDHPWVKFGNALPEIDETVKNPTSLKVHEQIVTDEEGRRRFHGAFTGGFSAGYYNTVGSKDGWTPATFKSSRGEKSSRGSFQPEDFMDDEDKSDHGIAPHSVQTHEDFRIGKKRSNLEEKQLSIQEERMTLSLGGDLIDSIVVPTRTNIGAKLLRKLGWKDGQGVGPRVARMKRSEEESGRSNEELLKVYGCHPPNAPQAEDDEDLEPLGEIHFAPKDTTPISLTPKSDLHGIGYSGIVVATALHEKVKHSRTLQLRTKVGAKMSFQGQAFGVGAYEEEDEDIYSFDSMSNYDVIMGGERNEENTHGWTKPLAITGSKHKEAIEYKTGALTGFTPSKLTKSRRKTFPPPLLPPNFDPLRRLKLIQGVERIWEKGLEQKNDELLSRPSLKPSIEERGKVLGEKFSVFDLISPEDKLRLQQAKHPKELGFKQSENKTETPKPPKPPEPPKKVDPRLMRPFASNPSKQDRFEVYEEAVKQRKADPYAAIESSLTEWERTQEREEFRRVSGLYSHFSGDISARFTSARDSDDGKVEKNTTNASVFGEITRSKVEWHPDPLLCKRFNVPDPYPKSDVVGVIKPTNSNKMSIFSDFPKLHTAPPSVKENPAVSKQTTVTSQSRNKDPSMTSQNKVEVEKDLPQVHEKAERPPMELFKSIFESGESSSEEEGVGGSLTTEPPTHNNTAESSPARTNAADVFLHPIQEDTGRSKHVFQPRKKFDRDDPTTNKSSSLEEPAEIKHVFNKPKKKNEEKSGPTDDDNVNPVSAAISTDDTMETAQEDFFGPSLPPPSSSSLRFHGIEPEKIKSSISHKKHKKHKKKKKKH